MHLVLTQIKYSLNPYQALSPKYPIEEKTANLVFSTGQRTQTRDTKNTYFHKEKKNTGLADDNNNYKKN